jgi:hypothetical protein
MKYIYYNEGGNTSNRNSLIVEYLATARRRSFEDYKPSRKSFYMALSFSNQYTGDN